MYTFLLWLFFEMTEHIQQIAEKGISMKKRRIFAIVLCIALLLGSQKVYAEPVAEAEPCATGLVITPGTNIVCGDTVLLSGQADHTENQEVTYRYIYYDGTFWRKIYSSDELSSVEWTPDASGSYLLAFQILYQDKTSNYFQELTVEEEHLAITGIGTELEENGITVRITPQFTSNLAQGHLLFKYMIYNVSRNEWQLLEETSNTACEWTPVEPGDYWIHIEGSSDRGSSAVCTVSYYVNEGEVLPAPKPLDLKLGAEHLYRGYGVELQGVAENTEGRNAVYRYLYYDGMYWNEISSADKVDKVEWVPQASGDYLLAFQIQYLGNEENFFLAVHVEEPPLVIENISTSLQSDGVTVKIVPQYTTEAEGDSYQFEYLIYDVERQNWQTLHSNEKNMCSWKPKRAGSYWIHVIGRTDTGFETSYTMGYYVAESEVLSPPYPTGLDIEPGLEVAFGTTVTLNGKAADTEGREAVYRYLCYDGAYWSEIYRSDSPQAVKWTPEKSGDYLLAFQVQYDENESNYFQSFRVQEPVFRLEGIQTQVKSDGTTIQILPQYSTDLGEDQFSFSYMIYDLKNQTWTLLEEDGGEISEWKPTAAGGYWIHIIGKTKQGYECSYTIGYTVSNTVTIKDLTVTEGHSGLWNSEVTLNGYIENPSGQWLMYEYLAYDGQYWRSIQKTTELKSASFIPELPGSYLLCFQITDKNEQVLEQKFVSYTTDQPYIKPSQIRVTAIQEKELNLSFEVETNDNQAEYRWLYYDLANNCWGEIQGWSGKKDAVWNPEAFGSYWIRCEARTCDGIFVDLTIGYQVEKFYLELGEMQVYTPDYATYYIQQNLQTNDPNIKYLYQIYDLRTKEWTTLGSGYNAYWQPSVSGSYWIHAVITGSDGSEYTNTIGYTVQGYRITSFGFQDALNPGKETALSVTGYNALNENYTFTYLQWNGSGWDQLYQGTQPSSVNWVPWVTGSYAFCCNVTNQYGILVDQKIIYIGPEDFAKNGWYYEGGYKFYYINNEKQLDLEGLISVTGAYMVKVNRNTCTMTIFVADGANGYIIPYKRFACSVGTSASPTAAGSFSVQGNQRWYSAGENQYGQYGTLLSGNMAIHSVTGTGMSSFNLSAEAYNMLGSAATSGDIWLSVRDAKWLYEHCKVGTQVMITDDAAPDPLGQGEIYRITISGQDWDPTDDNAIENVAFDETAKTVMHNIIYAVETGGQIYGNAQYGNFTQAYTNSAKETAITIGAGAWFATEAKRLLNLIREEDPNTFAVLDTAGIGYDLDHADWSTYGGDKNGNATILKGSAKAVCIQQIISTSAGQRVQNRLVDEQMVRYISEAEELGVVDLKAKMFCANVRHLGGYGAMEWVIEVCQEDKMPLTMDNIWRSMRSHTSNLNGNGVGANKYKSRHEKVMQWLNQYL